MFKFKQARNAESQANVQAWEHEHQGWANNEVPPSRMGPLVRFGRQSDGMRVRDGAWALFVGPLALCRNTMGEVSLGLAKTALQRSWDD